MAPKGASFSRCDRRDQLDFVAFHYSDAGSNEYAYKLEGFNQDWVYFGFSKQSVPDDMLKRLQVAYDRLHAKGTFEEIKQRYRY